MRNLWVAGRELTFACTYLAQLKTGLDGSPGDRDAGSLWEKPWLPTDELATAPDKGH